MWLHHLPSLSLHAWFWLDSADCAIVLILDSHYTTMSRRHHMLYNLLVVQDKHRLKQLVVKALPVLAAPTYGSMIKEYGQAGNVEQVWALWSEMEERGVKPTAIAFGCTVDPLVENGCVHDAWNHLPSACQHCYILRSSRVLQYRSRRNASSQFMLRCV